MSAQAFFQNKSFNISINPKFSYTRFLFVAIYLCYYNIKKFLELQSSMRCE